MPHMRLPLIRPQANSGLSPGHLAPVCASGDHRVQSTKEKGEEGLGKVSSQDLQPFLSSYRPQVKEGEREGEKHDVQEK